MRAEHRIIDAAGNRASEGLRTLEDVARFALDDAGMVATLKRLRHGLAAALDALPGGRADRLASRDTPGDTGTGVSTERESARADLRAVVAAAAARTAEGLRSIEECAKSLASLDTAVAIEQIRYELYDAAGGLELALGMGRARQWSLCVLITERLCRLPWREVAARAIEGGADCLQLREKELDGAELVERATELVELAAGRAAVIVNDRVDVAQAAKADGVHLGRTDLSCRDARRLAGGSLLIGVSTTSVDQARAAVRAGADYCGCGPMFASATKPGPTIAGPGYLRAYLADPITAARPHLAIGGIGPTNVATLAEVGCRGVAVSSAVCGSEDPGAVCADLVARLAPATLAP